MCDCQRCHWPGSQHVSRLCRENSPAMCFNLSIPSLPLLSEVVVQLAKLPISAAPGSQPAISWECCHRLLQLSKTLIKKRAR